MIESQFHSGQVVSHYRILEKLAGGGRGCFESNCSVQHAEASAGWERHPQPLGRKVGFSLKWARLKAVSGNMERRKSSIDAAVRIPYESLDFALDHLLLTCNNSEIGHVKKEAMFHYSDYGVDLGGDCVSIFDK